MKHILYSVSKYNYSDLIMPRSTLEVEVYTRTQVQGAGIGSQTVNSGEEVALSCQVRMGNWEIGNYSFCTND